LQRKFQAMISKSKATSIGLGLYVEVNRDALSQIEELDGCYVIITGLKVKDADTQPVYDRYKDLALVEHAFHPASAQDRCSHEEGAKL